MKTYSSTVTLQEILNDITLRVYNQNKSLTSHELLPLIQREFVSCKFLQDLEDPYYDKQGNYITQEDKSLLKKLKPKQRLDLRATMKYLIDMSIIPTNNPIKD
ncbi:MAG: hypothetical protein P1P65_07500 [Treponema sp.]